jgi:hypothetical protein
MTTSSTQLFQTVVQDELVGGFLTWEPADEPSTKPADSWQQPDEEVLDKSKSAEA